MRSNISFISAAVSKPNQSQTRSLDFISQGAYSKRLPKLRFEPIIIIGHQKGEPFLNVFEAKNEKIRN